MSLNQYSQVPLDSAYQSQSPSSEIVYSYSPNESPASDSLSHQSLERQEYPGQSPLGEPESSSSRYARPKTLKRGGFKVMEWRGRTIRFTRPGARTMYFGGEL